VCCGPAAGGFAHCFACRTVAQRLRLPLTGVLPVHFCPASGPLYAVLMGYKESPVDEARRHFTVSLLDHFGRFLSRHARCVEAALGGAADVVLPVPSTVRPGGSPLERVGGLAETVTATLGPRAVWAPGLLRRSAQPVGHMRPHPGAFEVTPAGAAVVPGARVVLLDDTYVSGARAQSAAAALRRAGAGAALIVPLGRLLRPDRSVAHAAFLSAQGRGDGSCARCVLVQTAAGTE
jgi:hypothetical protein